MEFNSLDEVLEMLALVRQRLLTTVEAAGELAYTQPEPGKWSVAETLDHMSRSEEAVVTRIKQFVDQASDAAPVGSGTKGFVPFSMDKLIEKARDQKFNSPPSMNGRPEARVEESLERLNRNRENLLSMVASLKEIDLSGATFPHMVFGQLNIYQWVAFIGFHEQRHLDQISDKIERLSASAS